MPDFKPSAKLPSFLDPNELSGGFTETGWESISVPKAAIATLNYLGEGGFGKVNSAIVYGTIVAVKELKSDSNNPIISPEKILDFQQEITIFKSLLHHNVLKFMGACFPNTPLPEGDPNANHYSLITEFAENGSLYDCLYNQRGAKLPVKFSLSKKLKIIEEIADGMLYLHSHTPPIYHLDLKSSNILLDENFSVRIGDFGLSQFFMDKRLQFKITNIQGGTPVYSAPEILKGAYSLDTTGDRADVYSYGILVNEIMTERVPFAGLVSSLEDLKKKLPREKGILIVPLWVTI